MSLPVDLRWILAALMAAVVAYHLTRLARRSACPGLDITHAVMGGVMAVMLVGPMPHPALLATMFAVALLWFVGGAVRDYVRDGVVGGWVARSVAPIVGCAAMVAMLVPRGGHGTMRAMPSMSAVPAQASVWLVWLPALGSIAVALAALGGVRRRPATLSAGCQIAMSATAACMLLAV